MVNAVWFYGRMWGKDPRHSNIFHCKKYPMKLWRIFFSSSLWPTVLDEWDFWKMWMLKAFRGKSWEPDFLTYFEYAEFDKPGFQAKFWVFDHLICINKMAAKYPLFQQCEAVSFNKSITKWTKWTTEMSLSMKWTSVIRIGTVLGLKWYAICINMQICGQICKLMAIT